MRNRRYFAKLNAAQTVKLVAETGAVTIKASAGEGDAKTPPTFSGVAYSGGIVSRSTLSQKLDADYIIDLSGMTYSKGAKANLDHKSNQRVGHLTDVQNNGKQVEVQGVLSAATPYRDEVAASAADGFGWDVSIEALLTKPRKLAAGKTEVVNGRTVSGPLYIFGKSVLSALGFVNNGADAGNAITIAASAAGAHQMDDFSKFVVSCGLDPETITDTQRATLSKAFAALEGNDENNNGGKPKSFKQLADEARRDRDRQGAIAKMGREAMRDCPLYIDQIETAMAEAIESNMSERDFELELLRNLRTRSGSFRATAGTANDPKVLEAAICMATGLPNLEKHFSEQLLDSVERNKLHQGFSIQSMLMKAAHANGYSCQAGERIHPGNIRAVLEHALPPSGIRAKLSGFSTASLPNILGAVANKQILAGYMEVDQTWAEIAQVKSVSNFYTQNYYRMLDSLEYEEVGSGGEIKHGTLGEETYTSTAKTYGKMLGITRTQIINDDLGAFDDIRERLGRGAAKKFANVFWTAFMNNSTFFTSALTNYISGSTTNLGTDGVGLGLMVAAFRQMTTPTADGAKRVGQDLNPTKILVPPELEANALIAYKNSNLGMVANSSANIYQNRFRPVVQWRLSNSSFTGYSTTAWYMFGDEVKPMLVTFLNGNRTPIVESTDADFDTLGILFRGYHDFGCDKSEYLAGIKSKGAS